MKRQGGFTLIELIIVILILAILGVTAAPKFWNFQTDARIAALNGLKSAIDSAGSLTYGKAAMAGIEGVAVSNLGAGTEAAPLLDYVGLVYGYPSKTIKGIGAAVSGIGDKAAGVAGAKDWLLETNAALTTITPTSGTRANCYLTYTEATASVPALAAIVITGC